MHAATRRLDDGFLISSGAWCGIAEALGLSQREMEVLQCVVGDQQDKEIAATLHLSRHTVRTYLKRLRAKLGASSRVALVARVFAEHAALNARQHPS